MTHTSGPWERGDGNDKEYGVGYMICSGPTIVAKISGFGYPAGKGGHPISDANARLIAAAPDLLAALQDCVESMDRLPNTEGAWRVSCLKQARAAIARATEPPSKP